MRTRDPRLEETAFPSDSHRSFDPDGGNKWPYSPGMSLRDYLAAAALTGLCSATSQDGQWQTRPEGAAAEAYKYADAMLAERTK